MDTLTFIAELAKAFAWPGFILLLILLLRKPIRDIIPLLTRLKYKDFELEFGRRVEEVKAEAAFELLEEEPREILPRELGERIYKLAEISPRAAVLEAWRTIENEAMEIAKAELQRQGRELEKPLLHNALRILERAERIDQQTSGLIKELRSLRNQAAHAPEFALSIDSVLEYAAIANRLARKLKKIHGV